MKDEDTDIQDSDSDLLGAVQALIPVPVLMTHSPLRGNCLQSLNEVPDSYDIDLDSTLQTIKFDLLTSDTALTLPPANFVIVPQSATDDADNDQNNVSNELREPDFEMFETSPKPSDAIDDEDDYVTVDSSVLALPSSFETSSVVDCAKEDQTLLV